MASTEATTAPSPYDRMQQRQSDTLLRTFIIEEGERLETSLTDAYEGLLDTRLEDAQAALSEKTEAISASIKTQTEIQTQTLAEQAIPAPWIYAGTGLTLLNAALLLAILIAKPGRRVFRREQAERESGRADAIEAQSRLGQEIKGMREQLIGLREKGDYMDRTLREQRDACQQQARNVQAMLYGTRRDAAPKTPPPVQRGPLFPHADMEALLRGAIAAGSQDLSEAVAPGVARAFLTGLGEPRREGGGVWLPAVADGSPAPYFAWTDDAEGQPRIYPNRLHDLPGGALLFDGVGLCATVAACDAPATGAKEPRGVRLLQKGRLRTEPYHPRRVIEVMQRINDLLAAGELSFDRIGQGVLPVALARSMNIKASEPVRVVSGDEPVPLCGLIERGRLYVLPARPVVIAQGNLQYGSPGIFKNYTVGGRVRRVIEPAIASPLDEREGLWDTGEWGRVEMEG